MKTSTSTLDPIFTVESVREAIQGIFDFSNVSLIDRPDGTKKIHIFVLFNSDTGPKAVTFLLDQFFGDAELRYGVGITEFGGCTLQSTEYLRFTMQRFSEDYKKNLISVTRNENA